MKNRTKSPNECIKILTRLLERKNYFLNVNYSLIPGSELVMLRKHVEQVYKKEPVPAPS